MKITLLPLLAVASPSEEAFSGPARTPQAAGLARFLRRPALAAQRLVAGGPRRPLEPAERDIVDSGVHLWWG